MSEVERGVPVGHCPGGRQDTVTVTHYEEITVRCDRCGVCFWTGPIFDRDEVAKAYTFHRHEDCLRAGRMAS